MSSNTLWIGDIDPWMDETYIKNVFINIAPIKTIKIMKKHGQSIGYGFLEFETEEIATEVLRNYNGKSVIGFNKLLKLARSQFNLTKKGLEEIQIYVCDMDLTVNEDQLFEFFHSSFKSVISAKIICDPITRISKGYGFIKFSSADEANSAVNEMNGKILHNKRIRVK